MQRVLALLADKLTEHLEGDDLALETLGEALEGEGLAGDEIAAAVYALRSMSRADDPGPDWETAPARDTLRVPSAEERESLSPEVWGYLLGLRAQGSLDPSQFERALDILTGSHERPVELEHAREVAARIALETVAGDHREGPHGDIELAH
jgi:uncharacterized protein Smg (DUF494 family)